MNLEAHLRERGDAAEALADALRRQQRKTVLGTQRFISSSRLRSAEGRMPAGR